MIHPLANLETTKVLHLVIIVILVIGAGYVIEKNVYGGTGFCIARSSLESHLSPLKQFNSGIMAKNVTCADSLVLVIKTEDGSPACVSPDTAQKLVERGWTYGVKPANPSGTELHILISRSMKVEDTDFTINYTITGNNTVVNARLDNMSKALELLVKTPSNGTLGITLPRTLIDSKAYGNKDDNFIVLADGQEIPSDEMHTTISLRTLSIAFQQGIEKITIIGTHPI